MIADESAPSPDSSEMSSSSDELVRAFDFLLSLIYCAKIRKRGNSPENLK